MEKGGVVRMEFVDGSRKSKRILLTQQGWQMAGDIIAPLIEAENKALGALNPAERRQLMELTRKHSSLLQDFLFEGA